MDARWERVHTDQGWHVRFRAGNAEPVVHGEILTGVQRRRHASAAVCRGRARSGP